VSRWPARRALLIFWLVLLPLALCPHTASAQPASGATPLRIAAAADLQPLLPQLLDGFAKQSGLRAEASYASSTTLATQIENGAPFDLFLSADMELPQKIVQDGFAAPGAQAEPYARGTLVLWTRNGSGLRQLTMLMLGTAAVRSVAIASPQHAPYGRAAQQALITLALLPAVQPKLRTAENIAQAAQFAVTGNADVALLSLTTTLTLAGRGHYIPVPAGTYTQIVQGGVILRRASHPEQAAAFLRYLHSPAIAKQLQQGGLEPLP
jgi:molybdate transport system substrate-binding protein